MFTKLFIIGALGTGALGTSDVTGIVPNGVEFAAGPVRVEAGYGNFISVHLAEHTSLRVTVSLNDDRNLQVKF